MRNVFKYVTLRIFIESTMNFMPRKYILRVIITAKTAKEEL